MRGLDGLWLPVCQAGHRCERNCALSRTVLDVTVAVTIDLVSLYGVDMWRCYVASLSLAALAVADTVWCHCSLSLQVVILGQVALTKYMYSVEGVPTDLAVFHVKLIPDDASMSCDRPCSSPFPIALSGDGGLCVLSMSTQSCTTLSTLDLNRRRQRGNGHLTTGSLRSFLNCIDGTQSGITRGTTQVMTDKQCT